MYTKYNSDGDKIYVILQLGTQTIPVICKADEKESFRNAARQFSDICSLYRTQYGDIDKNKSFCVAGFHFAYQLLMQSNIDKQS